MHEESGQNIEYVSGTQPKSDIVAKYIVQDPYVSGKQTSGIDTQSYYTSINDGTTYYNALSLQRASPRLLLQKIN